MAPEDVGQMGGVADGAVLRAESQDGIGLRRAHAGQLQELERVRQVHANFGRHDHPSLIFPKRWDA
jgi:hypothetical protein